MIRYFEFTTTHEFVIAKERSDEESAVLFGRGKWGIPRPAWHHRLRNILWQGCKQ